MQLLPNTELYLQCLLNNAKTAEIRHTPIILSRLKAIENTVKNECAMGKLLYIIHTSKQQKLLAFIYECGL